MSEPWNSDGENGKTHVDPHIKAVVMLALCWSAVMVGVGTCLKNAKDRVKRVRKRYNRNVDQEDQKCD